VLVQVQEWGKAHNTDEVTLQDGTRHSGMSAFVGIF
jgi:hypothetical protein